MKPILIHTIFLFLLNSNCLVYAANSALSDIVDTIYGIEIKIDAGMPNEQLFDSQNNMYANNHYSTTHHNKWSLDSPYGFFSIKLLDSIDSNRGEQVDYYIEKLNLKKLAALLQKRLDEFSKGSPTVLGKLFEQRMYWAVFDAIHRINQGVVAEERTIPREKILKYLKTSHKYTEKVINLLVRLIKITRLTPQDKDFVLNNYSLDDSYISKHYNFFADAKFWKDISNSKTPTFHSHATEGRNYFLSYVLFPDEYRSGVDSWINESMTRSKNGQELPKPPINTYLILTRRLLAIDIHNKIVALPIIEEIAVRKYIQENKEIFGSFVLDIDKTIQSKRYHYKKVEMDETVWMGFLVGAPLINAMLTTNEQNCMQCHGHTSPGPGDVLSFMMDQGSNVEISFSSTTQADITIEFKRQLKNFRYFLEKSGSKL